MLRSQATIVNNGSTNQFNLSIRLKNEEYEAEIIGIDEVYDIAVLKINSDLNLDYVFFGDSDSTLVGEWVLAVGNPYNLDNTADDNLFFNASTDVAGTIYYSYYGTAYNNGTPPDTWNCELNHPPNVSWVASSYNPLSPSVCDFSGSYHVGASSTAVVMNRYGNSVEPLNAWGWTASIWFVPDTTIPTALMVDVQPAGVVSGNTISTQPVIKIVDENGDVDYKQDFFEKSKEIKNKIRNFVIYQI